MSAPLSNELFFTAHRGVRNALGREQGLGSHWTASKETAEVFAEQVPGGYRKLGPDVIPSGSGYAPHTTITADIPMSSVETDTNVLKSKDVVGLSLIHI